MSSIDLEEASDWLEVTNSLPSLEVLRLSSCNLNFIFRPISHVNFSSLSLLDLSGNYLGNNIPLWVSNLRSLTSLSLSNITVGNGGPIPEDIQNLTSLLLLDLSWNSFNTSIPSWLYSLSHLEVLNLAGNQLTDVLPVWIFNFSSELQYLDLSQNQMHGRIPNLTNMGMQEHSVIDLSQNHFEGPLPLVSSKVHELDLSDNLLSGSISQFLCSSPSEPVNLAALYLANNQLSGKLPNCWTQGGRYPYVEAALLLTKGEPIEYNKTLALIPTGTQLQSFNSSSFVGNKLCGPPLTPNCSTNGEVTVVEKNRKEDDHEMSWFYIGMAVGFIVGFWGFCGSLIFNRTWRHSYFRFLDCIKDQIYVASVLKLRWFRKTITSCYNNQ
ncbi:hypothetical protein FEM48_ZijujUnG0115300 [Ziziphus jujuba var. spinosa]|uniref:Receptor-like protein EIX2 n=1 Tax=Ziziphus jujuba var. spinosa TaxID=714518 RepID=A0A978U7Y5_ZIZJJ|nr:hypothetical protein FEM48_ZijujUnG0115300 [Ziziphus jujuba var. spinosa]